MAVGGDSRLRQMMANSGRRQWWAAADHDRWWWLPVTNDGGCGGMVAGSDGGQQRCFLTDGGNRWRWRMASIGDDGRWWPATGDNGRWLLAVSGDGQWWLAVDCPIFLVSKYLGSYQIIFIKNQAPLYLVIRFF